MIKISKMVHGIPMITVWYAQDSIIDKGVICYKESKCKIGEATEFITLLSDLTEDADAMMKHFSSNCRNEVRRAYKDGSKHTIIPANQVSDQDIRGFVSFFEEFWKSKDSSLSNPDSLIEELKLYKELGALVISKGIVDGEECIYHTYLCDDEYARLLHSASLFRIVDGENSGAARQIIGRANRMLHYEDMLFFKEQGLKKYDWGGAGKEEEVASITKFKEAFGGEQVIYYESKTNVGIKTKLVDALSEMKHKLRD